MKIFRRITAIMGCVCILGVAGTDQHFTEMGQMPPDDLWIVFIIGFVLLIPTLIYMNRKVKK